MTVSDGVSPWPKGGGAGLPPLNPPLEVVNISVRNLCFVTFYVAVEFMAECLRGTSD